MIEDLRKISKNALIDILCLDETKFDDLLPDSQLKMEGQQFPPFRRDRNSRGGGKTAFVKEGPVVNILKILETKVSATIFLELTISRKKW